MTDQATRAPARRPSHARVRLLEIADELFYTDGINSVGIDRIIADAGVTKATFYKQYGSKDALILEYITGRDAAVRAALAALLDEAPDAVSVLAALVDAVVSDTARANFRGDPFINAAAEFPAPTHPVRLAIADHRDWFTGFLEGQLRAAGHPQPGAAADEFYLLRDGAMAGSYAGDVIAATSAFVRGAHRILAETPRR
ncbi:TetR/AcrR family transcriptional regulator [Amnibacterium sp.]|uniref:TetR/AcrR family transcriptional regulator n=1 Tax=Amnibacterium sp. TaxID=1872496 RepID=UPI00262D1C94|nr:TetR/AcrR family transcriptional regulator [Amnibacterium sp.]MCU1473984.1 TetR family transcriptional regulator [Amnibacterium sp.]